MSKIKYECNYILLFYYDEVTVQQKDIKSFCITVKTNITNSTDKKIINLYRSN